MGPPGPPPPPPEHERPLLDAGLGILGQTVADAQEGPVPPEPDDPERGGDVTVPPPLVVGAPASATQSLRACS